MNFINDTESPQVSMLENIFLFIGFIAVVFVLSAIVGVIYALAELASLSHFVRFISGLEACYEQ